MNKIVKVLICYSCLNSSAFSYGMQGDLCPELFSPETSEAWKKYALPREKVPSEETIVDVGQALSDLQESGKDDKIAKYLIENILLAFDSGERKACWTKCYNTWKRAKDLLANLVTDVDRISCDDERRKYQQAASLEVVRRLRTIRTAQYFAYDREPSSSWRMMHSTYNFTENYNNDQSATRRLYDSIGEILAPLRQSNSAADPVFSDVYFFMIATLDDIKIGETLYWQREADLLLFDAHVAALMERGLGSTDTIKKAVEVRSKSLLPPMETLQTFAKVLKDSKALDRANKLLAESMSQCSLNTGIATAIANKCENLMRIDCISDDEKGLIMQDSVGMFFDMLVRKHLMQFLSATKDPQISVSMVKELQGDFAALRRIVVAYANLHGKFGDVAERLRDFRKIMDDLHISKYVKHLKGIPTEVMIQLMSIKPEQLTQLQGVNGDTEVLVADFIHGSVAWLEDYVAPDSRVKLNTIISQETMECLTELTPETLQQLQAMPAPMRELFMRTPIEFAEMFDREIDCIDYIIMSLKKHAESIFQKDGDIKTYTKGWMQYILEMLKNFKKAEVAYGVQLAFSSASEIVIHNRLSGAFGGSYDPENVLDCFWNFVDSAITSQAMWDIFCEALKSTDYLGAQEKVRSKYFVIFKEKLGKDVALNLVDHMPSSIRNNRNSHEEYVKAIDATKKTYLLNNLAKLIEISQRLYGDASYAIQLIRTISKADDLYKALEASDGNIKYWLEKSILKDYIGRIIEIPIKEAVIGLL